MARKFYISGILTQVVARGYEKICGAFIIEQNKVSRVTNTIMSIILKALCFDLSFFKCKQGQD